VGIASPVAVEWLGDGAGRPGPALAGAPEQLAAGPGGSVVALTSDPACGGCVALVPVRPRAAAGAPAAGRRLGGLESTGLARLAADGQRYAVVGYRQRVETRVLAGTAWETPDAHCPLLVVDLLSRESVAAPGPCRAGERLRSLVLESGGDALADGARPSAIAYVGLEGTASATENGAGRLVLVALPTGMPVGARVLEGAPVDLRLGAGEGGAPAALYLLELGGGAGGLVPTPERGRVAVIDPLTLDVLASIP
jgi:hypothetical protein